MSNVLIKLSKASADAAPVIKGERVPGMHFNPLQHDQVQAVAMVAFKKNKLYPVCEYENELKDNYIFIKCNMKIYDTEDPKQFIEINGCSAMGKTDKFGSGNAMSYAKKYAFLNALNLRTALDNDDGQDAAPFPKAKPIAKPKINVEPLVIETSEPVPKLHIFTNNKAKTNSKSTRKLADDWIGQMTSVAKHSKSQLYFEKNLTPIREEYKSDLMLIASDVIEQMRVDTIYNKLKSQIQNRSTNGR